jgi:hypothetical protein
MSLTIGTETALTLYWSDINNTVVANPNNLNEWNAFFQLPTYGTPFNRVRVNGNVVTLMGGKNITIAPGIFRNEEYPPTFLTTMVDNGCIIAASQINSCPNLTTVILPSLISIGSSGFSNDDNLSTITLSALQNLGPTRGDDNVFSFITVPITLTVPIALSTINGGFPDGDIYEGLPVGSIINYVS